MRPGRWRLGRSRLGRWRLVAPLAALLLLASGCAGGGMLQLEATFPDVLDLVPKAFVRAGDVTIGRVTDISLTENDQARVVMEVEPGTGLPAEVEAVLKQTSLLGERYIELRPLSPGGTLSSGVIQETRVVSDLEDLVSTGNDLLAGLATDRLAAMLEAGAVAFGERGQTLGALLTDLETFVGRYDRSSGEVVRLLDAADAMLGGLAEHAETNAAVLADLARATDGLAEEDDRLLDAIQDLGRLADVGAEILATHRAEMDNFLRRLRIVLDQIIRIDGALQNVLTWLPRHNIHVPNGVVFEMSQVWNDFSVCGTHSERNNPSNSCDPPNPGRPNHPIARYPGPDACDARHEGCPYGPDDGQPYRPGEEDDR